MTVPLTEEKLKFCQKGFPEPFAIKQIEGTDDFFIEGYASTKSLDRGGDVVEPEAFRETMAEFMKNPIVFYMHVWYEFPVGKVVDWRIDEIGLWVRIYVSKSAPGIRILIAEGILKGLSIAYDPIEIEYVDKGLPAQYRILKKLNLYEISIVNIPMNAEALMELAKSKGLNIGNLNAPAPEGTGKEGVEMILQTKFYDQKDVGGGAPAATDLGQKISNLESKLDGFVSSQAALDPAKIIAMIQEEAKKAATPAQMKELIDKASADLMAAWKEIYEKQVSQRKIRFDVAQAGYMAKDLKGPYEFKAAFFSRPAEEVAVDFPIFSKEQIRKFQRLADDLLVLHYCMIAGNGHYRQDPDPRRLKSFRPFLGQMTEFQKALNTQTAGEGLEWIPTEWSADLMERIEVERRVAKFIPRFPMPAPIFQWPIRGVKPKVYIKAEATTDYPSGLTHGKFSTGKVTFNAQGVAGAIAWSDEVEEDSIIAVMPTVKGDLVSALVDMEEDALINGDNSASHQDSDVTDAADHRKLFKGFRKLANSAAKVDVSSGWPVSTNIRGVFKKMGKYGVKVQNGLIVASPAAYFDMLGLAEVKTIDVWGPAATYLRGELTAFLGRAVVPSEFVRQDLNHSGLYDGTTKTDTIFLTVFADAFKIGDRRQITMESDKEIATGLYRVVATQRLDFQKMVPAADDPVAIGYKIAS